ncbi:MAG: phosphomannomutase/phosphoglucomutase, partial [Chloroflexi bacterium]
MIDESIFKKYDIRGKFGEALTEDAARQIGQAFGTALHRRGLRDVVIGQDNRASSPALSEAAIEGLVRAGCVVTDIGMSATPVVYWCAIEMGNAGGMMVTGSHLKPAMNGFKLSVGMSNLYGDQIKALHELITQNDLAVGEGHRTTDHSVHERYLAMLESKLHHARSLTIV